MTSTIRSAGGSLRRAAAARPRHRWSVASWIESNDPRHRRQQLAAAFVLYGYAALAAYWPVYPGSSARLPSPGNGDAAQDTWFLGWTADALAHGRNIFFTTLINVPFGINTAQNTQMPLLGIVASPLTLAANPLASYTLLMWLAFPLSALSAAYVAYRWCNWFPAAMLAGALYGFGPYVVNEGVSHLNLTFVPLPPLIVMAAYELVVAKKRAIRWGCWLGVLVVLQYYISPEIAATTVLLVTISLLVLGLVRWRAALPALRYAAPGLLAALLLIVVGTASPVWWMLDGVGHYTGRVSGAGNPLHADLLGAVVPTGGLRFYPQSWKSAGDSLLAGNVDENGSFLGIPLLVLLAALVWRFRRNRWLVFGAAMLVVAYLASMGPQLTIDGHSTSIYLPMDAIANLRLGDDILPSRMSLFVMLGAALVLALGLAEWHRSRHGNRVAGARWLVTGGVLATVLSLVPALPYPGWSVPFPNSLLEAVRRDVPAGSTVLAYPYPTAVNDQAMMWQALAGMRFRLVGGYALNPSPSGDVSPNSPTLPPAYVQDAFAFYVSPSVGALPLASFVPTSGVRQFLRGNGIDAVVVDRDDLNASLITKLVTESVGPPVVENASVAIWLANGPDRTWS